MSGQRYCEQCGTALAPQLRFCERCGTAVRAADATPPVSMPTEATRAVAGRPAPAPAAPERRAQAPAAGSRPALLAAALLVALGLAAAAWLLRPSPPAPPGAGLDLAPSAYDDLPAKPSPLPPLPAEAPPLPDDPLAQARERRERAYERYTRMAIGEIDGDIDAARREYQQADAALKALESR
ncbi:MAG: hypothetical protein JNL89_12285 [Rhodanobacteraceae bacterium]|nr:hypothetical protein [Rhodanobacteraceae bacterium]